MLTVQGYAPPAGHSRAFFRKDGNMNVVYVLAPDGTPLMPCSCAIARLLLKDGKAKVKRRTPFTIKLLAEPETTYTQQLEQMTSVNTRTSWSMRQKPMPPISSSLISSSCASIAIGKDSQETIRQSIEQQG